MVIPDSRRRHYLARVSIFLIAVALMAGMVGCGPTSQNLEIRTWYDLDAVRNNLRGHHILMNDLDSTTAGYEELASPTANEGKGWQPIEEFTGCFDGQGYEIKDLHDTGLLDPDYAGLFGRVFSRGVIKDVGVVNATVSGDDWVGSLVGENYGTVSNCYFTGSVNGEERTGGLVGWNRGTVSNCHSSGNVTGEACIGGLVGSNWDTVSDCYSSGNVTGDEHVGGLVGCNPAGTVRNSYSTASVTGNSSVGGLVGGSYDGSVSNSYSTANVTGYSYVGGLLGSSAADTVSDSYSTGSVTGVSWVGGLVGRNKAIVNNSFWDIETSGQTTSAGGIGKTTAEMKDIATFSDARWDIIAVALGETNDAYTWNIVDKQTHPFLSWQA